MAERATMSYVSPRTYAGNESALVIDFFSSFACALGRTADITAQCDKIVATLLRRYGIFDLGGMFHLHKHQFVSILRQAPDGYPAAPDDWAESLANLAQFNFKVIQ